MRNLFITLLLCIVAFTAKAQQMYEDKNIDYSFDSLKVEAAKGNVIAIFYLGGCYSSGRKANKTFYDRIDYDKAMEYYKKAADYGYPWAASQIAHMYALKMLKDTDTGTNKEMWHDKAFKGFKQYADRGETDAYGELADYYGGYWGENIQTL